MELHANSLQQKEHMSIESLKMFRSTNPTWRLLTAQHAPYIISFFYIVFIAGNRRQIPEQDLINSLDNYIFVLAEGKSNQDNTENNETKEDQTFTKTASEYLDEWADDKHRWLRKYYTANHDEPFFDLTPQAQKSIDWLMSLRQQTFIGTESRLFTVLELLRQIVVGTQTDPEQRLAELEKNKAEIENEIEKVNNGEVSLLDETQIKERYWQAMTTAI